MEIVSRSVCAAYKFEPSAGKFTLSVPAIAGVMGHLSFQMLSEPEVFFSIKTHFFKVGKDLVEVVP